MWDSENIHAVIAELTEAVENDTRRYEDSIAQEIDTYEDAIEAGFTEAAANAIDNYGGLRDALENLKEDRDQ